MAKPVTKEDCMNVNDSVRKPMRRNARWLLRLTALLIIFPLSFDAGAEGRPDYLYQQDDFYDFNYRERDPVFEFRSEYRGQISYSLKLYQDGKVVFRSYTIKVHVKSVQGPVVGERQGQITREQLKELTVAFFSLPFREIAKYEEKGMFFEGSTEYLFFRGDLVHIDMREPLFYQAMMTKLKKITDIQKWLCYPKGHPQYYPNCLKDLPDDYQF